MDLHRTLPQIDGGSKEELDEKRAEYGRKKKERKKRAW